MMAKKSGGIRDRIKELRRVSARELLKNPKNWRKHGDLQRSALLGALQEVGYADALLARETPDGLVLIDGHLRADLTPGMKVPVLVIDVTEGEADKLLASIDPLSAMAEKDDALYRDLLAGIEFEDEDLRRAMGVLEEEETEPELHDLEIQPAPVMTWVLIGIPTTRFLEIAEGVERIAQIEGVVSEVTANDG